MIHDAAGCADDDVRAVFQAGHLRTHGGAATQRNHLDIVCKSRETAYLLRDLIG